MRVVRAAYAGACYGVQRALDLALKAVEDGGRAYTLGPLIHNPQVVAQLAERGVRAVDGVEDVAGAGTVVSRSPGVPPAVKRSVAANGLSSYHEGSTYELYPDCPGPVVDAVLSAGQLLGIEFGSFDVIESDQGDVIIDANSVSNVSEDCTELFGGFDLMAAYAQAIAARWHETALR